MKLRELANAVNAVLHGDPDCQISGAAALSSAKKGDISFLARAHYRHYLPETRASAVILRIGELEQCPSHALVVENPELAFATLLPIFEKRPSIDRAIHPSVILGSRCQIDQSVSIAAGCVIGHEVSIGANTIISPNTVIGDRTQIGANCYFYPNVTLYHDTVVGNHVILHSGAVIGSDGFGLVRHQERWKKIPQIGRAVLGNNVEVGANTTIDRGALGDTIIEEGVKLDNQIQIAHNVSIGSHTAIAACAGIAGSTRIGSYCMIGGGACIKDHITIVDRVMITGMSMVTHSLHQAGVYSSGTGTQSHKKWLKSIIHFHRIDQFIKKLKHLTQRLKQIERHLS